MISKLFSDSFITINTAVSVYFTILCVEIICHFFFFVVFVVFFSLQFWFVRSFRSSLSHNYGSIFSIPYHFIFYLFACISTWGAQLTQFTFKKPFSLFFLKISINKIQRGWERGCICCGSILFLV